MSVVASRWVGETESAHVCLGCVHALGPIHSVSEWGFLGLF